MVMLVRNYNSTCQVDCIIIPSFMSQFERLYICLDVCEKKKFTGKL